VLETGLADDPGAWEVAAVLAPPVVADVDEQPAASTPPASVANTKAAGRWHGPTRQVQPENLRTWLLMSRSLAAAAPCRLRQST
jgi:hypothetical protein